MFVSLVIISSFLLSFYLSFYILKRIFLARSKSLRSKALSEADEKVFAAKQKRAEEVENAKKKIGSTYTEKIQEFFDDFHQTEDDFRELERLLSSREKSFFKREEILQKKEKLVNRLDDNNKEKTIELTKYSDEYNKLMLEMVGKLENIAELSRDEAKNMVTEQILEMENAKAAMWLKEHVEEIEDNKSKYACRVLDTVLNRYEPKFVPSEIKTLIQFPDEKAKNLFWRNDGEIVEEFIKLVEVKIISLDNDSLSIKISDGYGVDKEKVRRSILEMISLNKYEVSLISQLLKKYDLQLKEELAELEKYLEPLLGRKNLSPELIKYLTALNYRASFTQNQFYHSLEVSSLAGILAAEMDLDIPLSKRIGLLHDLGKSLDYRIEGSHAVISADYAARYGESDEVCNTVKSHHNDIILETPLADLLKSADALSSARPGARVDLEEGYTKRIDAIRNVFNKYPELINTSIMHAGREIRVFVDSRKINDNELSELSEKLSKQIESEIKYPGQVKLTVVRQMELSSVI